jgi:signal transduction histidine kinase
MNELPRMRRIRSIRARLSLVFLFLFLLVMVLGLEALRSLSHVNDAAAQIRLRWLPSTRALGDLNNLTTDFPAAEAALLRAGGEPEKHMALRQMSDLDRGIAAAEYSYRRIRHDPMEEALFRRFEAKWLEYRSIVTRGQASAAAYEAANSLLASLTDRNEASAREASESSERAYSTARGGIAFAILLAGILVAGAMFHVTRSISAPLVELAERMHRLAASETDIEIHGTRRHDEIGEMARAVVVFRNNAIDLAQSRQTLARQAALLQEKLAEEQRLTRLQRNFVSMASHEFRTPLAIIDGHAQRLVSIRDRSRPSELPERARRIRSMVGRMTQLIDNLIGSARLNDAGTEFNFHPTPVDLSALLLEICELQHELAPDAQISRQVPPHPVLIQSDAGLLRQLFGNLLSNAVKYSPAGGPIKLEATQVGTDISVVVEDRGIGIPEAERERIFERYYRGSNTTGVSGSGVGLQLVKTIVELHDGSIALESREGEGSRFTIRLPAGAAAEARCDEVPDTPG